MKKKSPFTHKKNNTARDFNFIQQQSPNHVAFTETATPSQNNLTNGIPIQSVKNLANLDIQWKKEHMDQNKTLQLIQKQNYQTLLNDISINSIEKSINKFSQLQNKSFHDKELNNSGSIDKNWTSQSYLRSLSGDSKMFQKIFPPKKLLLMPNTTNQEVKKFPNVYSQDVLKKATDILKGKDPFKVQGGKEELKFECIRMRDYNQRVTENEKDIQKSNKLSIAKMSQRRNILTSQSRHQRRINAKSTSEISSKGAQENEKQTVELLENWNTQKQQKMLDQEYTVEKTKFLFAMKGTASKLEN